MAVGQVRWTGGSSNGDLSSAGNWVLVDGVNGSTPPATGDTALIDSGNQNIIAGLTTFPASGSLAELRITPGWTGSLGGGAAGSANIAATLVNIAMGGAFVYLGTGTRTTTNVDDTGRGTCLITGGTNTTLTQGKGNLEIGASAVVVTFKQAGGTARAAYNATAITTAVVAGTFVCARPITTIDVTGLLTSTDITTATFVTTGRVWPGGRWNHRAVGNLATFTLYPNATLDAKGGVYSFTVGSTAFEHWVGSNLDRTGTSITITVSNETPIGARSVA